MEYGDTFGADDVEPELGRIEPDAEAEKFLAVFVSGYTPCHQR
eukprot:CAMPEP_0113866836 /NCGR_PEP_ID=MMETSP0780_2-20120614/89_1 /TAXON_ID=652834 /ORGANISM="Palpitomonas bilix" /LENGTH=42 /DNA_ID=CAMNT_0000851721 /DNA_START=129 /DNA_END=257 /DNA_ORIENTATION=+ /assembly_acc=CAM_ASM_000599